MPVLAASRIPTSLTALVGRERCLADIGALVAANRLVTLVGPGGIGKTRLAAAIAEERAQAGGTLAAWVDLTAIGDPAIVPLHVAASLGVRDDPVRPVIDRIAEALTAVEVLVVLDNCEHVLAASAELVALLLRSCPQVRVLTTSRQALGVPGEKAWLVPPLEVPARDDESADATGAVALFVQRANDAHPAFALTATNRAAVARIARRLDGLPLAIELAAARTRLLPPEQLERRLDDAFSILATSAPGVNPRHRTLRALIDWSHALLEPAERLLFERLAVFAGSFSLESLEEIAGFGECAPTEVLECLAGLVDKSLVHVVDWDNEARYTLRETVRQYADDKLEADGRRAVLRERHARHFLALAERAAPELHAHRVLEWLTRLDADHDNLRTALRWALEQRDSMLARRLCLALRDFWRIRGHLSEGRRWLDETLALPGDDDAFRARVLVFSAVLSRMQGDHASFARAVREAEAIARRTGDPIALADALTQLGVDQRDTFRNDEAKATLDEAIPLWRRLGDGWGLANALAVRSSIALEDGALAQARALRLDGVEVSRRAGDREGEARGLVGLGEVARLEGDYEGASAYYDRALAHFRELGDLWHCAATLHNQGWVLVETGRVDEAQASFEESLHLFTRAGNQVGVALTVAGLGRVLLERGDPESATVALAMAAARFATIRLGPASADKKSWERARALAEAAVPPDRFAALWEEGGALSDAEALEWMRERVQQSMAALRTSGSFPVPLDARTSGAVRRASAPAHCPYDLRVRALGPLEISIGETRLQDADFGGPRPRELLLLLLCHPAGRTREQVGLAFWPESSTAQVKNRFHVTLHRLRKALGHPEWITSSGERYLLEPTLRIDFDAQLFEEGVTAALRSRGPAEGRLVQLTNALALHRGDLLEGESVGDWHLDLRDRLQVLYLDAQLAVGGLHAAAGDLAQAVAAYRAILARDPLHEEAARRLMLALDRAGERTQALQQFRELVERLERELGVEPDARTVAVYDRLRAS